MSELYGQLESEKIAEQNLLCRKIVNEISQFGVTDRQRLFIINLLALELENNVHMQEITSLIKSLNDDKNQIFLIDDSENK